MRKNLLSIATIVALSTQPANSFTSLVEESGVWNQTSAGSWKDPSSGLTYHSGGSLSYKFTSANRSFPPPVKVRGPSAKTSCNGISLDAGYLAIIDGKQFEEMLKNAGAAAGYGLVLGLISTMPNIADTFQKINEWSRKIQELLQNSCQMAQKMMEESKAGKVADKFWSNSIGAGFKAVEGALNEPDKQIKKYIKEVKPKKEEQGEVAKETMPGVINLYGTIVAKHIFIKKDASNIGGNGYEPTNLFELSPKGKSSYKITDDALSIRIASLFLFFGDVALVSSDASKIFKILTNEGTPLVNEAEFEGFMGEQLKGAVTPPENPAIVPVAPVITDSKKVVSYLLYGSLDGKDGVKAPLSYPAFDVYLFDMETGGGASGNGTSSSGGTINAGEGGKRMQHVVLLNQQSEDRKVEFEWDGIYEKSKVAIEKLIDRHKGNGSTDALGVYVAPQIQAYTKILAHKEKMMNVSGRSHETLPFIELLARENAKYFVDELFRDLSGAIAAYSADKKHTAFDSIAAEHLLNVEKRHREIVQEVIKVIGEMPKVENEGRELAKEFEALVKQIREQTTNKDAGDLKK